MSKWKPTSHQTTDGKNASKHQLAKELSDCVVICQSVSFKSFEQSKQKSVYLKNLVEVQRLRWCIFVGFETNLMAWSQCRQKSPLLCNSEQGCSWTNWRRARFDAEVPARRQLSSKAKPNCHGHRFCCFSGHRMNQCVAEPDYENMMPCKSRKFAYRKHMRI